MKATLLALLVSVASCTAHTEALCAECEGNGGPDQGNCQNGLYCDASDACIGHGRTPCGGLCLKSCSADGDCPEGRTCSSTSSYENGHLRRCSTNCLR